MNEFGMHITSGALGVVETPEGPREIGPGHVILSEQRYLWLLSHVRQLTDSDLLA